MHEIWGLQVLFVAEDNLQLMHGNLKATEGCKYINFSVGEVLKATEGIQFVSIAEDWRGSQKKTV